MFQSPTEITLLCNSSPSSLILAARLFQSPTEITLLCNCYLEAEVNGEKLFQSPTEITLLCNVAIALIQISKRQVSISYGDYFALQLNDAESSMTVIDGFNPLRRLLCLATHVGQTMRPTKNFLFQSPTEITLSCNPVRTQVRTERMLVSIPYGDYFVLQPNYRYSYGGKWLKFQSPTEITLSCNVVVKPQQPAIYSVSIPYGDYFVLQLTRL